MKSEEEIIWAKTKLNMRDSSIELVTETPWSSVIRLREKKLTEPVYYLKITPSSLALEPIIIEFLKDRVKAPVPDIIAHNPNLNCFIMRDSGVTLRSVISNNSNNSNKKFTNKLISKSINQFTLMQKHASRYINDLIALGVPDWRIEKFPELVEKALGQYSLPSWFCLEDIINKVKDHCDRVEMDQINQTIVQPDFNDKNTLVNLKTGEICFIDLGEIVISHPHFSLINFYEKINKSPSEQYKTLKILSCVYDFLAYDRLCQACGYEKIREIYPDKEQEIFNKIKNVVPFRKHS